ncbi:hypothetical protein LIER_32048 [Lithospermum erythrorhizon]|uniref:Reverse transcriptase domain-containing protein n=1 Tax=Lithospermum erythrorhizon TaxID=34254 RepID=A0AAV3RWA0_LITER
MGSAPQLPTSTLTSVVSPIPFAMVKNRQFRCGDFVVRLCSTSKPREHSMLSPKWEGPYRVKKVVGPSTYELEDLEGKMVSRTWHASKLCK